MPGSHSPADDLLCADSSVPYPESKLAIELQCEPHIRALRGQIPRCVPFLVPKLRVGSTRQEQPEEWQKALGQKLGSGHGCQGLRKLGLQNTVVVALPGSDVQGRVPVVVDSMEVTPGVQEDLGNGSAAREGGPVQANVLLLWEQGAETALQSSESLHRGPKAPRQLPSQHPRVPHVVSEGDVGTTGQQHPDHVNVLVLGCPDDGCPAPTVLREGRKTGVRAHGWKT